MAQQGGEDPGSGTIRTRYADISGGKSPGAAAPDFLFELVLTFCLTLGAIDSFDRETVCKQCFVAHSPPFSLLAVGGVHTVCTSILNISVFGTPDYAPHISNQ